MQTILIVDDDALVLGTLACIVERAGFRALRAHSGQEALALATDAAEEVDLLLCDVLMPGMHGPEVADRFLRRYPAARVLFIAGFEGHPLVRERVLAPGLPFLAKPFLPGELLARITHLLAAPASPLAAGA